MVGTYLGEYALSYNPTRHGRPGLGASKGSAKWFNIFNIIIKFKNLLNNFYFFYLFLRLKPYSCENLFINVELKSNLSLSFDLYSLKNDLFIISLLYLLLYYHIW